MNTYVINIATLAKKEDAYNEVVTNLYPIIIKTYNEQTLQTHLKSLESQIKSTLKNKYLYDNSYLYIRIIDGDEFKWKLSDIVKLTY